MAIGYQFRACNGFPELLERGRAVKLSPQDVLIAGVSQPAGSTIFYEYSLDYKGYHKYKVEHETLRKMRVRFEKSIQESVIEQIYFEMYVASDRSHMFLSANDATCEELLKRARKTYSGFTHKSREIDLQRMNQEGSQQISGGWFKEMNIEDVSAAALFGAEVSLSEDWERFSRRGKISVLLMNYEKDTATYKVAVGKNGGIVIYNKLQEEVRVQLLDTISRELKRFEVVKPISSKQS